jgi:hypothetical protein
LQQQLVLQYQDLTCTINGHNEVNHTLMENRSSEPNHVFCELDLELLQLHQAKPEASTMHSNGLWQFSDLRMACSTFTTVSPLIWATHRGRHVTWHVKVDTLQRTNAYELLAGG